MGIVVHFAAAETGKSWNLHAWQDGSAWHLNATGGGAVLDFTLPDEVDARKVRFKFVSTDPGSHKSEWEPEDFVRMLRVDSPAEIWVFAFSGRVLYQQPFPPGVSFAAGQTITVHVLTRGRFRHGELYAWNPYAGGSPSATFGESARDDQAGVSTFTVTLPGWMTSGFHFKLKRRNDKDEDWEADAAIRVWRPVDGNDIWIKSGQVSVRRQPLALVQATVEAMLSANGALPALILNDPVDRWEASFAATSVQPYAGSPLFRIATYAVSYYPDAVYNLRVEESAETAEIKRPFPADPANVGGSSRFAAGVDGWLGGFPAVLSTGRMVITPRSATSFGNGLQVQVSLGSSAVYETVTATLQPNGRYEASVSFANGLRTWLRLIPAGNSEPKPYDWIDTARYFAPTTQLATWYTTEGVYGLCAKGPTVFGNPPNRKTLMQAAFGAAIASGGVFGGNEMPHGATIVNQEVYFVVHAPHAVLAELVLIDEPAAGGPARVKVPMQLTDDLLYWWCVVPLAQASPGKRYRFALNDRDEVIDPAARAVRDCEKWNTDPSDSPGDPQTTWSLVLDVHSVHAKAHSQPWQTMGWEALLVYEIHPRRFTDKDPGALSSLELLADELKDTCRRGQAGYLNALPITALELLPVHEFKSNAGWGYNSACYFAVDSSYGGAEALAELARTAHRHGRALLLDVVYNHSLDSPLMKIARDVYRNGDAWGDRMNCGHPMVLEFLRQATAYLWRTFALDGFRLDDTKTIINDCQGGWEFIGAIREAVRRAASADGQPWPYCVAENDPKVWDMPNPKWSIIDGEWAIDEVWRILDSSYLTWKGEADNADELKKEMDNPSFWGRPFYMAMRFGESHDMVSEQESYKKRIAARPKYGGLQLAKALGTVTLAANGVPMLFMGQEVGETRPFSFDNNGPATNPQSHDLPSNSATDNTRVLAWFRSLMGLRNDVSKGLRGDRNYQVVRTGRRTVAFTCGEGQRLFVIVTFGTPDTRQNSAWLGLPDGNAFKEIFNSSWPAFQVEFEQEQTNGGHAAAIYSGQVLHLPHIGAVVLERW